MKRLFILIGFLVSYTAIVHAEPTVVATDCYTQTNDEKELNKLIEEVSERRLVVGQVIDSLIGELDPNVLGDGGLLVISTSDYGNITLFEADEDASQIRSIQENADKGLKQIAVRKACLTWLRPTSRKANVMDELTTDVLNLEGSARFYEFR